MGRELRSILLTKTEVDAAVTGHIASLSHQSNVLAVDVIYDSSAACRIELDNPALDGRSTIILEKSEFIEALIAFVRSKGQPLPRRGSKEIAEVNGELALMIELDWF
ncbi:MAG: hypothetical protein AAF530_16420 [Pseudomonadota bacterium]